MKIIRVLLVLLVLVLGFSAAVTAQNKGHQANRPAGKQDSDFEWWGKNPDANKNVARGTVAGISTAKIDVQAKDGVKSFTINEATKVIVSGKKATLNDVKANDPVMVKFQPVEGGTPVALGIVVPKPGVGGKIVSISGNTITIANKEGQQSSVTTTSNTKYECRRYTGTVSDLKVGYVIEARGSQQANGFVADVINFTPDLAKGVVTAVSGNSITVKTVKQAILQLQAGSTTTVLIRPRAANNVKGTLADVKQGQPVNVGFIANPNGAGQLLWIDILTGE